MSLDELEAPEEERAAPHCTAFGVDPMLFDNSWCPSWAELPEEDWELLGGAPDALRDTSWSPQVYHGADTWEGSLA